MTALLAFCRKEVLQALRDKTFIRILLVGPIIYLAAFGYVANSDVRNIRTIFVDHDGSAASRSLQSAFTNTGYFQMTAVSRDESDVRSALDGGHAQVAVIIPPGYQRTIASGGTAHVQVIIDGTDSNVGLVAQGYASSIIASTASRLSGTPARALSLRGLPLATVDARLRFWFNPTLATMYFMIPGIVAMILVVFTVMLTAQSVVKERVSGTLEQLMVTPIRRWQFILGKILPYVLMGLIDVFILVGLAVFWFRVPLTGSFVLLVLLCMLGEFALIGQGLLVSTVSRTQEQATVGVQMLLLPSLMLSGFMFPIASMPKWIQWVSYFLPLRYLVNISRGIFLKADTIQDLWPEALALFLLGVVTFSFAVSRFTKQLEV